MSAPSPAKQSQRADALVVANKRRSRVARFKEQLRSMDRADAADRVAEVLISPDCDEDLEAAVISALLTSITGIGEGKCSTILRDSGVNLPGRRLRNLTERQRRFIAAELEIWAEPRRRRA